MKRRLRIVRDAVIQRPEVVHDANDYLASDPLNGVGVPSSFPIFEEAMNAYYNGPTIQRMAKGEVGATLPLGRMQRKVGGLERADF